MLPFINGGPGKRFAQGYMKRYKDIFLTIRAVIDALCNSSLEKAPEEAAQIVRTELGRKKVERQKISFVKAKERKQKNDTKESHKG